MRSERKSFPPDDNFNSDGAASQRDKAATLPEARPQVRIARAISWAERRWRL